jgi:AcrR family transcriptional regulator
MPTSLPTDLQICSALQIPSPAVPTQAERRESTRAAVLEAAIESLVTHGYAATTTARIAELAGVSRGAAPHYSPSKADLLAEAVAHQARRRIEAIRDAVPAGGVDRNEAILDLIWEAHRSALFAASVELWVAARSDLRLRDALTAAERQVRRAIWDASADIAGRRAQQPGFREDIELLLATVRGLALLPLMGDASPRTVERRWKAARERLLRVLG